MLHIFFEYSPYMVLNEPVCGKSDETVWDSDIDPQDLCRWVSSVYPTHEDRFYAWK